MSVEAEQNTPPGSPSDRVKYIVGTSPTGAWASNAADIAEYDNDAAAWVYHTPAEGARVYDKTENYTKKFNGTAWEREIPGARILQDQYEVLSSGPVALSSTYATVLTASNTITAASTSNFIYVDGFIKISEGSNSRLVTVGVFVDAESSPRATVTFNTLGNYGNEYFIPFKLRFNPSDTSAHTIRIKAMIDSGSDVDAEDESCCVFEERAA